jgi:hypothetical protein
LCVQLCTRPHPHPPPPPLPCPSCQEEGSLGYTVEDGDQLVPRVVEELLSERVLQVRPAWTACLDNGERRGEGGGQLPPASGPCRVTALLSGRVTAGARGGGGWGLRRAPHLPPAVPCVTRLCAATQVSCGGWHMLVLTASGVFSCGYAARPSLACVAALAAGRGGTLCCGPLCSRLLPPPPPTPTSPPCTPVVRGRSRGEFGRLGHGDTRGRLVPTKVRCATARECVHWVARKAPPCVACALWLALPLVPGCTNWPVLRAQLPSRLSTPPPPSPSPPSTPSSD